MIFHISNTKLLDLGETSVSFFVFMLLVISAFRLFFAFSPFPGEGGGRRCTSYWNVWKTTEKKKVGKTIAQNKNIVYLCTAIEPQRGLDTKGWRDSSVG